MSSDLSSSIDKAMEAVGMIAANGTRPADPKMCRSLLQAARVANLTVGGDDGESALDAARGLQYLSCRGRLPEEAKVALVVTQ